MIKECSNYKRSILNKTRQIGPRERSIMDPERYKVWNKIKLFMFMLTSINKKNVMFSVVRTQNKLGYES